MTLVARIPESWPILPVVPLKVTRFPEVLDAGPLKSPKESVCQLAAVPLEALST